MPRPDFQQSDSGTPTPSNWEALPWTPDDRVVEEPMRLGGAREEPMLLDDDHVVDAPLDSDSIRRA